MHNNPNATRSVIDNLLAIAELLNAHAIQLNAHAIQLKAHAIQNQFPADRGRSSA